MSTGPAVAVVLVCHDSAEDVGRTLELVGAQLRDRDELVIVDNASADATVAQVRRAAPGASVLQSAANLGFAGGCGLGARHTSAELLLFLNPDARPAPGCLEALRACAPEHPSWGAWQALVVLPGGQQVNTAGNPVHFLGFGWAGGHGRVLAQEATAPHEVPSASGAAFVVRRAAWDAAGGFDAGYFMYGEDLDLSLRLRLAGWGVGIVPSAQVEHDYAFVKGDYKWFHLERNRWWTILGVYPARLLVLLLPALVAFELVLLPAAWRGGWLRAKLRAQIAVVRTLRRSLRRRRAIQPTAQLDARAFAASLTAELDSEFLGAAGRSRIVLGGLRAYWRCVLRAL
jgi:GT2 family glycosyltransferase